MRTKRSSEKDNSIQLGYVQITPQTAPILLKILELESEGATISMVAKAMGKDRAFVYDFIKEAERDSRQFLICNDWSSTKGVVRSAPAKGKSMPGAKQSKGGGRHTDILEIRPDRLITNPLSAKIMLTLAEKSKESREVNEKVFLEHLLRELDHLNITYPDLREELTARINFLTKIGDICNGQETVPNIIWISWLRYHSQKAYLELLVKEKLSLLGQI